MFETRNTTNTQILLRLNANESKNFIISFQIKYYIAQKRHDFFVKTYFDFWNVWFFELQ